MVDYAALRTEIDTDPLVRGYAGMTDQQIAESMNALDRPAAGGVDGMLHYLLVNRSRDNSGSDTIPTALIGRLYAMANANEGDDVFGVVPARLATQESIHAARLFLTLVQSPHLTELNFLDTEVDFAYQVLGGGSGRRVWKPADITALQGLSKNQQSRASEIGLGRVHVGDVTTARTLP